jgi:hypothetical protein
MMNAKSPIPDPVLDVIQSLQTLFASYSVKDVAETLFISSLWLPNMSSWFKHQIMVAAFISMKPATFSESDMIATYDDFKDLIEEIYPLVPSNLFMEDYVPQLDWGEVRYFFEDTAYKIFYGCNIETIYDFLYVFDLMFASRDDVLQPIVARSPRTELVTCLQLQDTIISYIDQDPHKIDIENIEPGYLEVPLETFWMNARAYYNAFDSIDFVPEEVFDNYSIALGSASFISRIGVDQIVDLASTGELIDIFFVEHEGKYYSVLPRMFSEVLIQQWAKVFAEYMDKLLREIDYQKELTLDLLIYVSQRHNEDKILALPSPVSSENKPEDLVFACGFISRDRLFLVYVAHPIIDKDSTQSELEKLASELHQAIESITREPISLALHMDREIIFISERGRKLRPEIIIVLPSVSIDGVALAIPEDLPGTVMFIHDFLGLFDELDDLAMLSDFFDFLRAHDSTLLMPFYSFVDKYGAFQDMHGVIVPGARDFTHIMLDPHWGSHKRYETLGNFWQLFPTRVGDYLGHPRRWSVEMVSNRPNLVSRQYVGRILISNIGRTLALINSPLHLVSPSTASLADLLTDALEDSLTLNADVLSEHSFFQGNYILQITVYPSELILKNDKFQRLRNLMPSGERWKLDNGVLGIQTRGIRIAFDETLISKAFLESTDRTLEADLLSAILIEIDKFAPSPRLTDILAQIKLFAKNELRYKMHEFTKMASFPEYVSPSKPEESHRKAAGKLVAQTALDIGVSPGQYELDDAKTKLNNLRKALVARIDDLVREYSYQASIQFLIEKIDALIDENFRARKSIEGSLVHEVEYDRVESSANHELEFLSNYKAYQYLIEKFVQLTPDGTRLMQESQFQSLIALIARLIQVYQASDSIYYGAYPVTLHVDEDFIISATYNADIEDMQQIYHQEMARIHLGLTGNTLDRIDTVTPEFMEQTDRAFHDSLEFRFTTMVAVLRVLSLWADLEFSSHEEATFYSARLDELTQELEDKIEDTNKVELSKVLDFLTLSPDQMLIIYGQQKLSDDLPVWEHFKRPGRYSIRPIIRIENQYYWGAYSASRAGMIWISALQSGKLPFDIQEDAIKEIIEDEKKKVESVIVNKTAEILSDFTPNVATEVQLHKRDRSGEHPQELGDYDVLAYVPERNILLNVECKDILPAYCLKDDSRIRRKFFGDGGNEDKGYLEKVEKREAYLSENAQAILEILGWKSTDVVPKVISMFVSSRAYWWTRFPPVETSVYFTELYTLRDFLTNQLTIHSN